MALPAIADGELFLNNSTSDMEDGDNSDDYDDASISNSVSDMSDMSSTKSSGKSAVLDFAKLGLHGRSKETAILLDAYRRISRQGGRSELVLVKGESGIGKSALVEEIRIPVTSEEPMGRYVLGKFDLLRQIEGLTALVAAFSDLCDLIIESDDFLQVRETITVALGDDAHLLMSVIPNLANIISDQSNETVLQDHSEGPSSSGKLASVFRAFLKAVSSPSSPIVMHLDDIHWADNQSQDIIQALVLDSEIKNVLIVCTYRNTEEGERIRQHICGGTEDLEGLCMSEIELGNLAPDAAMSMLRDVLCSGEDDVQSLCAFITQKTASNPYFICQFLELLQSRRLLKYSSKLSVWQFDLLKIQSEMDSSENVVDIVFERISCLGPLVQGVLQLASCLGHKFDGVLLEAIVFSELDNPGEESWLTTNPALMGEHSSTEYRVILATAMKKGLIDTIGESGQYKFTHDRIQSAFYAMIPVLERERLHFRIGTWIRQDIDDTVGEEKSAKSPESLNRLSLKFIDSILLIAVDQLNRGAEHVRDTSERIAIANLNLTAADTAIGKLTFIAASDFLRAGLKLLGQDKWDSHYGLTRDLTTRLAHSELCLGNFDASEMAADDVIQHTQNSSKGDSVKAYITKIQCLSGNGKLCEAIDLGFFVLELLGECFNRHWKVWNALSDMSISQLILLGKSDDDLMSLPLMEDEDKVAAMRVLGFVLSYAYLMQDTTSLLLSAFRMMKLSLTCGKSPSTPFGIACYGVFTSTTENFEKAYRYGNLALRMQEQLQAKEFSLLTVVLVYSFANHWKHPLSDGLVPLLNSYKLATETGTAETAFNCIARYAAMAFQCGSVPLWAVEEELRSLTHKFVKFDGDCEENEPTPFWQAQLVPYLQATLNLMGQSEHTVELTGEVMDQEQLTREAMESGNKMATTVILFNRYFLATIFEEYEAAEECISELETSVGNSKSKLHYAYWGLRFYRGLNSYGMFRTTGNENYLREARRITKELSTMSDLGYTNCTPMCLLLAAEECASSGNTNDARETYDRAICSAAGAGCIHFEGIANEKCGAMFLKEGQLKTAEMYLRRALALMSEWGANAKVEQIEEKYRLLLFGAPVEVTLPLVPTKRSASSGRQE